MKGLSVIVVSYNTKDITLQCVTSLSSKLDNEHIAYEIIIVDNCSTDGSVEALKKLDYGNLKIIYNTQNKGYGKANNQGLKTASKEYILFLNSDVIIDERINFQELVTYLDANKKIGALTVKVLLPNGSIDPASHRGFPTVWRSFCYFFGLEKIFSFIPFLNKLFGGYHLINLDRNTIHEIDSPTGAFFLVPSKLIKEMGGFDEDFFMYGEDLDLSFRIKERGYKIIYYPMFSVLHLKYQSGLQNKNDEERKKRIKKSFFKTMAIFYRKHYEKIYPTFVSKIVYFFIHLKEISV